MTQFLPGPEVVNRTRIINAGVPSSDLTKTQTISGSGTWSGDWERAQGPEAQLWVKASGSATLFIEFSHDEGTTVSQFPLNGLTLTANVPHYDHVVVGYRFFRLRVTDLSGSDNTVVTVVNYGSFSRPSSIISTGMTAAQGAITTKSVLFGQDIDNSYHEVKVNPGGEIFTADANLEAALGRVSDRTEDTKFAHVVSIDAIDNAVDIWSYADDDLSARTDTKTFPTSAVTIHACSDSASDTSIDLTIGYIDANGAAQTLEVTGMNIAQAAVSFGVTGLDVNRAFVSGSTAAVGNIYILGGNDVSAGGVPNDPTDVLAHIRAGYGQTQQAHFTVPTGVQLVMTNDDFFLSMSRSSGAAGSGKVTLRIKELNESSRIRREFFVTNNYAVTEGIGYLIVPAQSQIVWRLDDVSDTDTNISLTWSYLLVNTV